MPEAIFEPAFWVAVAFIVFMGLVLRPVGKIILKALDNRTARIRAELDEAIALKNQAEAMLAEFKKKHKEAMSEAHDILEHAKLEAERMRVEAKHALDVNLAKRTEIALQKIASAEQSILADIQDNAIDITLAAARTLIMENLGRDAAEEIIHRAITEIDRKLH